MSMRLNLEMSGLTEAQERLAATEKQWKRATTNGINRAATRVRREIVDEIAPPTGLKRKLLNAGIDIRRAKRGRDFADIVPSSAGVPVKAYRHTHQVVDDTGTRAQIRVGWPGGQKVAAGFINPKGKKQAPLRTRSHKGKLIKPEPALGPSVAAAFRMVVDAGDTDRYTAILAEQVRTALDNELRKKR